MPPAANTRGLAVLPDPFALSGDTIDALRCSLPRAGLALALALALRPVSQLGPVRTCRPGSPPPPGLLPVATTTRPRVGDQ